MTTPPLECLKQASVRRPLAPNGPSQRNTTMPRDSNRGRGHKPTQDQVPTSRSNRSHNARDEILGEAASAESGSHPPSATPPGVGGRSLGSGTSPESARYPAITPRKPGEKPKTGDVVPSRDGKRSFRLSGKDPGKLLRCSGSVSTSECIAIVASLATQGATVGRKVLLVAAGNTTHVLPRGSGDRTSAVLRWTKAVIGRPVGLRVLRAKLKVAGLWAKVEAAASGVDAKEKRRKAKKA